MNPMSWCQVRFLASSMAHVYFWASGSKAVSPVNSYRYHTEPGKNHCASPRSRNNKLSYPFSASQGFRHLPLASMTSISLPSCARGEIDILVNKTLFYCFRCSPQEIRNAEKAKAIQFFILLLFIVLFNCKCVSTGFHHFSGIQGETIDFFSPYVG